MSMRSRAVPLLLAALLVTAADAPPDADLVAQRGDVRLTVTELQEVLSSLDPTARAQVTATQQSLANFVRERVLNMAILADAKAKQWDTRPEVVRKIAEMRDAVITQTYLASLIPPIRRTRATPRLLPRMSSTSLAWCCRGNTTSLRSC